MTISDFHPPMIDLSKSWPVNLNRRTWPAYLVGLVALLSGVAMFDAGISRAAIGWPENVRAIFAAITDYGLSDWILIPSLLAMILSFAAVKLLRRKMQKRAAWEIYGVATFIFLGVGLPGLAANLIKRVIGRGRPEVFEQAGAFDLHSFANSWVYESFPSGHSTTAIGFAFVIGFLWPRLFWPLQALGLLVAFSRIPTGMHYPTDVTAGFVLGALGAYAIRNLFATRRFVFKPRADGHIVRRRFAALSRVFRRQMAA